MANSILMMGNNSRFICFTLSSEAHSIDSARKVLDYISNGMHYDTIQQVDKILPVSTKLRLKESLEMFKHIICRIKLKIFTLFMLSILIVFIT